MNDHRKALQNKFQEKNRYANFGNVLMRMHIKGFRCHTNTVVEVKSPITAFCGSNGVGKSTLIQLAATAYQGRTKQKTYNIPGFFPKHRFDPKPCTEDARVEYKYWQEDGSCKQVTLSSKLDGGWDGYLRRPKKTVLFVGVSSYLPRGEKNDIIVRNPEDIQLLDSNPVENEIKEWSCKILSKSYEEIVSNTIKIKRKTDKINSVKQNSIAYSETHMGFGEARSQYLIRVLEELPNQSLILIEEPEISLHPSAQYHLGCYLVNIAMRKEHQIFLSTHSEYLLKSLPSQSRIYLKKTDNRVEIIPGIPPLQAQSLMSEGHKEALCILVEDKDTKSVAKPILSEIIRLIDHNFLDSVGIYPAGSCDTVKKAVKALKGTGLPVAAVLDADQTDMPKENIFKLPGSKAPEKEVFGSDCVRDFIQSNYKINIDDFTTNIKDIDHHYWFEILAKRLKIDESFLVTELSRVYVNSLSELELSAKVDQLKEACR